MSGQGSSIKAIDSSCVHRICSGQVILDLSSALKELVENSVDAGSTRMEVRLKEFGLEQLEVSDNGLGIKPEDYELLAVKHATSKLSQFEDISNLITFGFRGEALSSLCAISEKVTIVTRTKDQCVGTKLEYDKFGKLKSTTSHARDVGTTITLDGLFQSLPVRYKDFMKNKTREYQRLLRRLQAYALIHTNVRFSCSNQAAKGRTTVLTTPGSGKMLDAITCIFGARMRDMLNEIEIQIDQNISFSGMISKTMAGNGLSSTDRQFLYLNKRPVDIPKIAKVINEVYKSFNMHQYPIYVLNIVMPTNAYDVNVTPDKRQVMIHKERDLVERLKEALKERFEPLRGTMAVTSTQLSRSRTEFDSQSHKTSGEFADLNEPSTQGDEELMDGQDKDNAEFDALSALSRDKNAARTSNITPSASLSADKADTADFEEADPSQVLFDDTAPLDEAMGSAAESESALPSAGSVDSMSSRRPNLRKPPKAAEAAKAGTPAKADESVGAKRAARAKDSAQQPQISAFLSLAEPSSKQAGKKRSRAAASEDGHDDTVSDDDDDDDDAVPHAEQSRRRKRAAATAREEAGEAADQGHVTGADAPLPRRAAAPRRAERAASAEKKDVGAGLPRSACSEEGDAADRADVSVCEEAEGAGGGGSGEPAGDGDEVDGDETDNVGTTTMRVGVDWDVVTHQLQTRSLDANGTAGGKERKGAWQGRADECAGDLQMRLISKQDFLEMKILGQFNLGFIIAELRGDLYILDQHACDEKYRFETLQESLRLNSQRLVAPKRLEIEPADELVVEENLEIFKAAGFELRLDDTAEAGRRVQLVSVPLSKGTVLGPGDVHEMLCLLRESPGAACRPSRVTAMLASRACRSAVMIGTSLTHRAMRVLVDHMATMEQPWNCPHGRPTMRHLYHLALPRPLPPYSGPSHSR